MAKRKHTPLPPTRQTKRPARRRNEFPVISPTPDEEAPPEPWDQVTQPRAWPGAVEEVTVPRALPGVVKEIREASRGVAQRAPSSGVADDPDEPLVVGEEMIVGEEIIVGKEIATKHGPRHPPAPARSDAPRQPSMPRAVPAPPRPPAPAHRAQTKAPVAPPRARTPAPAIDAPKSSEPATYQRTDDPNTMVGRIYPDKIYRFRVSERMLHWSIAVPFLTCAVTAAILFFVYNRSPQTPFRPVFSWTHRISGAALIALPLLAIVFNIRDIKTHLSNIREGWSWRMDDVKWLALMPLAIVFRSVKLPEEGKFNAGEKLNFMASMGSYAVMGSTGILLWLTPVALGMWFVHLAAAAALLPLVGGHMFMALINPSSRIGLSGMLTGWVDREWASHHYRRWYRQIIARHMRYHGRVPELDTTEHDELKADESALRHRHTRTRWLVSGVSIGLAVAMALGATGYAMRDRLPYYPAGAPLYLAEDQPLRSRPAADAPAVAGAPLKRGAQVLKLATSGDFALVQDATARAGYVPNGALMRSVPPAAPASEPSACAATAEEAGPEQCEACADARRDACVKACPESRKEVCSGICEERRAAAIEACGPAVPLAPLAPEPAGAKSRRQ